jgi:Mg-chelatase subunit ChlD
VPGAKPSCRTCLIGVLTAVATTVTLLPVARAAQLRVGIEDPAAGGPLTADDGPVEIRGRAELFGPRNLDLFLVVDTSKSLQRSDPDDLRRAGARALTSNLLALGRTRIGIIDYDARARVVAPLTDRREPLLAGLDSLDQHGKTNLAAGIELALDGFAKPRADTTRAILLISDGHSDDEKARRAAEEARERGVVIHGVLVGGDIEGEALLRELAATTRGTFVRLTDPARLTREFLDLRATGVTDVSIRVDGGEPVVGQIAGARFRGFVPLGAGEHRIVARAKGPGGAVGEGSITVTVRAPGCAELVVRATRDGAEVLSLAERNVLIVLDSSNSMWVRMQGDSKLEIAQQTLEELLGSLPPDLRVGLRVYGHRHRYERRDCEDSELLVPLGSGSRRPIVTAIEGLEPRGQTPLAFSLAQAAGDFERAGGERAILLVTDGIESCAGDPVAAVRGLQADGPLPVHVIFFGLPAESDEDAEALRAIADASGGRFLHARSRRELFDALVGSVGTAFSVHRADREVAASTLGADDPVRLEPGDYTVRLASDPPFSAPVTLSGRERLTLTIDVRGGQMLPSGKITPAEYSSCEEARPLDPSADGAETSAAEAGGS